MAPFRNPAATTVSSTPAPAPMLSYTTAAALYHQQMSRDDPPSSYAAHHHSSFAPVLLSPPQRHLSEPATLPTFSFAHSMQQDNSSNALTASLLSNTASPQSMHTLDERTITIGTMQFSSPSATGGTFPVPLPTLLPMRNTPRSSPRPTTSRFSTTAAGVGQHTSPSLHPSFMNKAVCNLRCKHCESPLSRRGMRAILLADTRVELYSTDAVPRGVQLVAEDYRTQNCHCRIRDIACLSCGCVIGYHVSQPCSSCLDGSNNGHLWMFHSEEVSCAERLDPSGGRVMKWGEVGDVLDEEERNLHEITVCR